MGTDWTEGHVANGFESYDDTLGQLLGYPYVYKALGLSNSAAGSGLDYGCGPGKVAVRFAKASQKHFYAVDESSRMIDMARSAHAHPLVSYRLIQNDDLPFVPNNALQGAMLCFVILNLGQRIKGILDKIYKKLGPGAPRVILDTNPITTGLRFTTFQSGLRKRCADGDKRPAWLFLPDGKALELTGYFWSRAAHINMFEESGYEDINLMPPTLADLPAAPLRTIGLYSGIRLEDTTEWSHPPFPSHQRAQTKLGHGLKCNTRLKMGK